MRFQSSSQKLDFIVSYSLWVITPPHPQEYFFVSWKEIRLFLDKLSFDLIIMLQNC